MEPLKLLFATNNPHKVQELLRLLGGSAGVALVTPASLGLHVDVEETETTYMGNARLKAEAFCKASGLPAVADDSGIEVDALGGAPGVYSARYAGEGASGEQCIEKLLAALKDTPDGARGARFACAICCVFPDGRRIETEGFCPGRIAHAKAGGGGFGYDPVFIEATTGRTFSELSEAEKDALSHRGVAVRAFAKELAAATKA